ncbi:HAD hydrolase family protein [Ramlibacter sp. H39-3-26]|uniref:KdsC family phosphatase n=1 Tax=Curvibacter soli TaxID=3031331 RepID=UPI0023DC519B|nr:HAD hydrolase family protein [Ramlibacter sp. H39-3-26]MDF1486316.1 HAD hydrolase family protein [Ramlibacter sp. H39-3-26]
MDTRNDPAAAPTLRIAPELLLAARDVVVVFFDVDGVLTDGGLYLSDAGEQLKRFDILDGYGFKLLRQAGIEPAVVTGRDSAPLRQRLQALGVRHARLGTEDKRPAAEEILAALGLSWPQAAAMGDDWPDLPVLRRAAFACAPANAHAEVRAMAHYVTQATGGHGAARELCDLLATARGRYAALLRNAAA